jgi:hypothetical protein
MYIIQIKTQLMHRICVIGIINITPVIFGFINNIYDKFKLLSFLIQNYLTQNMQHYSPM